jgi:hypothetical protein
MTIEQAKFLKRVTEDCGNQECDIRETYSGRGMYGRETVGIVVDSLPQLLTDVLNYINDHLSEGAASFEYTGTEPIYFDQFRTDNMGRSMILY